MRIVSVDSGVMSHSLISGAREMLALQGRHARGVGLINAALRMTRLGSRARRAIFMAR
ncbi:MAG: hypothetical protein IPI83_07735 [Sphingomonadales bacterium]|nr:hypothetical protein [Sphingomonadales bacterium]